MSIQHTARLPFGYECTFRSTGRDMNIEWFPGRPEIRERRAQDKFFKAYESERAVFLEMVAATLGASVVVVDVGSRANVSAVLPPTKH